MWVYAENLIFIRRHKIHAKKVNEIKKKTEHKLDY